MSKTATVTDIIEWDIRNWSVALDFWRKHSAHHLSDCLALEVGSRNGGLSLWMALNGARVICSDLRGPAEAAILKHRAQGVSGLVQYESIDAMNIPYTDHFDVVLFKSVLGTVGRHGGKAAQAKAVSEMHKALKPGGELFFAENLVASPLHMFFRRRCVEWGATWRYVSAAEMHEFLSPFAQVHWRTVGFAGAFGRSEMQRNLLGAVDRAFLDRLVPADWRYIVVGVARK
jgi:SAM-dependent methyltransferase